MLLGMALAGLGAASSKISERLKLSAHASSSSDSHSFPLSADLSLLQNLVVYKQLGTNV